MAGPEARRVWPGRRGSGRRQGDGGSRIGKRQDQAAGSDRELRPDLVISCRAPLISSQPLSSVGYMAPRSIRIQANYPQRFSECGMVW